MTVEVHSLVIGGPSGPIHIVDLPVHSPASLASSSCILPGVPASMQAFMSSMVQPGGSFNIGLAGGFGFLRCVGDGQRADERGDAGGGDERGDEQFSVAHRDLDVKREQKRDTTNLVQNDDRFAGAR